MSVPGTRSDPGVALEANRAHDPIVRRWRSCDLTDASCISRAPGVPEVDGNSDGVQRSAFRQVRVEQTAVPVALAEMCGAEIDFTHDRQQPELFDEEVRTKLGRSPRAHRYPRHPGGERPCAGERAAKAEGFVCSLSVMRHCASRGCRGGDIESGRGLAGDLSVRGPVSGSHPQAQDPHEIVVVSREACMD